MPSRPTSRAMRVLLLGGSGEASALATRLREASGFAALLSLAGATRNPARSALPTRIGGFGGVEGLVSFLRAERIGLLVDATHPFAARISGNAARAAAETAVPLLRLQRPEWRPRSGDRWVPVPTIAAAAAALASAPQTVLLTVGRRDLAPFRDQAPQHRYLIRCIDPPDPAVLPPDALLVPARFPLIEATEIALLREHGVAAMVAKNAGGDATAAKLLAARRLGLPVVMVSRPSEPGITGAAPVTTVPDAEAAMAWLIRRREAGHAGESTRRGV